MSKLEYKGDQNLLSEPYLPSEDLKEAVNLAIALERPLLIMGEPGSGKTRLAKAVAEELRLQENYYEWPVKSTSQARDGLYIYDTIGRLRDAQLTGTNSLTEEQRAEFNKKFNNPEAYIQWGPLGEAFRSKKRAIVLIDEIDKADIDFPNDLLQELDKKEFEVFETFPPIRIQADKKNPPIIFITSNAEKQLPDAFLRRCLFFHIDFPDKDRLREIASRHLANKIDSTLLNKAVDRFWKLRERMDKEKGPTEKKVSTSELIDWLKALVEQYSKQAEVADQQAFIHKLESELLFPSALLKSLDDQMKFGDKRKPQ